MRVEALDEPIELRLRIGSAELAAVHARTVREQPFEARSNAAVL
jgi:hypothetical protein